MRGFIQNISAVFMMAFLGCSWALDFDRIDDLPCDCLPGYVCLLEANRCVPEGSVENFKFCTPDALDQDALCQGESKCLDRGSGYRCLPPCTITNYSTPNAGARVRAECPTGTLCWTTDDGGRCDEGECSETRQDCAITQKCVAVNGAGRCFTTCNIFDGNDACAGDQACHLLLDSNVTSCIETGAGIIGNVCDDDRPCAKFDMSMQGLSRPMICASPLNSGDARKCLPICSPGTNSAQRCGSQETCQLVITNVDAVTGANLGVCKN